MRLNLHPCLLLNSFSLLVEELSIMLMPKLHMHSSHLRSQQNEYKVNKAAVRRTGDILCKIICDIPVKIKLLFCVRLENFDLFLPCCL